MLIAHALLSTNSFLLVDAIARRFKTRLITEFGGLNFLCPKLFFASLVNLLIFLGFPGSIFFVDLFPLLAITLLLFLYLLGPTFFFRSWVNLLFGFSTQLFNRIPADLSSRELVLFMGIPALMY
jgi:NADH:ubiquinone oxidoreductase subunit 4 (subunit M)